MTVMTLSIDCTACILIPDFYSIRYYVSNEWCPNVDSRKGSEIYSKHRYHVTNSSCNDDESHIEMIAMTLAIDCISCTMFSDFFKKDI